MACVTTLPPERMVQHKTRPGGQLGRPSAWPLGKQDPYSWCRRSRRAVSGSHLLSLPSQHLPFKALWGGFVHVGVPSPQSGRSVSCSQTFLVVTAQVGMLQASSGGKPGIPLNSLLCPHPHDPEWPQRLQRHDPYFSTLWRPPVRGGMRSPPKKRHLMLPPLGLGKPSQAVVPEKPTLYRQHHGDLCQTQ